MPKLTAQIQALPKAEIHVHIDCVLKPDLTKEIADRNGIKLSDTLIKDDGTYYFRDFLDLVTRVNQEVADVLRTRQDYEQVTYEYLKQCAAENTVYVELIACPGQCERTGISYKDMIDGIAGGIDRAREGFGIESLINVTFERHRYDHRAKEDADRILSYQHPYIVGLDIAGGEQLEDLEPFVEIFEYVIEGFNRPLSERMHSAEGEGPENLKQALKLFRPTRIGHGVRSIEDLEVVQELIDRNITLEVCPSSNKFLMPDQYGGDFKKHPLRQLYDMGVKVTLNSDDPGVFPDCTIGGEYQIAHDHFGFTPEELLGITKQAIACSYAPDDLKVRMLSKVDMMYENNNDIQQPLAGNKTNSNKFTL